MDHTSTVDYWLLWEDGSLFKAQGANEQGKPQSYKTKPQIKIIIVKLDTSIGIPHSKHRYRQADMY